MGVYMNQKGQAVPEKTEFIPKEAFGKISGTKIHWLGGGGAMINSRKTCKELVAVTKDFHATQYVAGLLKTELNISGIGHKIGEQFESGNISVTLTPA